METINGMAKYISMMSQGKYSEAYEFLLKNSEIIDNMKISELAGHYQNFKTVIPIGQLNGLTKVLKERILGIDVELVFP